MKVEGFSDVGRSEKSGFKKDKKFFHKKPRHDGEWNRGQGSPTKDKPKQFQSVGFKPKGNFVKKGAPFKGSQPKGDVGVKPYLYNSGITNVMPVAGGCLTRKNTQECLAVLV
jgi:hypothetical protein